MSDIIQLLPDSVANQIAAGEVIQRPASVVKELVENAVDAGASHIEVVIIDAGRTLIQVVDDGCGMSETDARLAFERHATSKIRKADDLFTLKTMGFRGEALPSIAAVAQVQLLTRTKDDEVGTQLIIEGSRVVSQEAAACPAGCNFRIENLFFNIPARRKFLKSNTTELSNILTAFERIALVYPQIHFTLLSNNQELLNLRTGTLLQRITDIFGKKLGQDLLHIDVDTSLCQISGFVGKPESARRKGVHNCFFVNGRFMKHAYFHKAVTSAFDRLLPEGTQVPYFIYFNVNPADIDVNIHPTKTEIKFENEQTIWQILMAAVRDAIGRFRDIDTIDFDTEGRPDIPAFNPMNTDVAMPKVNINPAYNPFKSSDGHDGSYSRQRPSAQWQELYAGALGQNQDFTPALFNGEDLQEGTPDDSIIEEKSPVHYQYKGNYILTAVKSGLMFIDQHRADLRIQYEHFREMLSSHPANSQPTLFPEIVQMSPSDSVMLQKIMPLLTQLGFSLRDLGGNSYAVDGLPVELHGANVHTLMASLVSEAIEHDGQNTASLHDSLALGMARHAAITAGEVLSNEQMEQLVNRLFACSNVKYTPDGKPILAILPHQDIEALLK